MISVKVTVILDKIFKVLDCYGGFIKGHSGFSKNHNCLQEDLWSVLDLNDQGYSPVFKILCVF